MKWKDVLGIVVITLLVVAIAFVATRGRSPDAQAQKDMKTREDNIEQYESIAEEQRLITEILKLRYEAALIQQKFNPASQPAPPTRPVVEPPIVK
jgi:hypothetical protein